MQQIKLSLIHPDPDQPRQQFNVEAMDTLEKSIKERGILMPLIVEEQSKDNYLLIDGERRYRTSLKLGLKQVPVEIMPKMNAKERMISRFHIQEQHQSWSPFDKARAIYFFMQEENLSQREISELLGMAQSTVNYWIGILELSKRTQIKSVEMRIPFIYLHRIVQIVKEYKEITKMSTEDIEEVLLVKIKNKAIQYTHELSSLVKFMKIGGNVEKKLKFLKDPNYTVKNLLDQTPAGKSIAIDKFLSFSKGTFWKVKTLNKLGYGNILVAEQKMFLKELVDEINKFIK